MTQYNKFSRGVQADVKGIVFRTEILLLSAAAIFLFLLEGLTAAWKTPEGVTIRTDREAPVSAETGRETDSAVLTEEAAPAEPAGKLNINTAGAAELTALPGIGEVLAERIVAYREEHGPFAAVEDIQNVPGIGEGKLAAAADRVTVGTDEPSGTAVPAEEAPEEPSPETEKLNINTAGAEELTALPGIGEVLAERIVAYRAEHGPFAAVEDIRNVQGIGEGKLAAMADRITVGEIPGD
ncbi:ComEA family DNA-binding protein [Dysosmobacter sp. HCP28S3_G4]|uniref:ComEA family DNA-binding protein n=1 Tax=Dysosmobacter sp. HCP28S3_G4 TaxID=3438938 RepID=UPI003F889AF6